MFPLNAKISCVIRCHGWSGVLSVLCAVRKLWIRSLSCSCLALYRTLAKVIYTNNPTHPSSEVRLAHPKFFGTFQTLQTQQPCNISPVR